MSDQNQALDLASAEATGYPGTDWFIDNLSRTLDGPDAAGIVCRLTVTPTTTKIFVRDNILGKRRYDDHELDNVRTRYDAMLELLSAMVDQKFTILRLEVAAKDGLAGSLIEFTTPSGRKFTHQYFHQDIRSDEKNFGSNLIPNDFLRDLKMFPSRHT